MKVAPLKSHKRRIFFALVVLAIGCAMDGFFVEPNWIEVTHESLPALVSQSPTIAHGPIFFSRSAGQYDLALAGHSHGGQVRVPFWGPLWLPGGIGPYVQGWFAAGGSRMYVSRGIGTTLLPVRFACRPELAIVTLQPMAN
jgi:predicted MPP superfamily phosphohydrolase